MCCWLFVFASLRVRIRTSDLVYPDLLHLACVGLVYGLVSQGIWMTSVFSQRAIRWGTGSGLVIIGAWLLTVQESATIRVPDFRDELANLGGMAIAQSIVFFSFGIPAWHSGLARQSRPLRQFAMLDITLLTLATAIVLSLAMKQPTPIEPADYWYVMLGVWAGLPTIAAVASIAATAKRPTPRILAALAAAVLAALGCAALIAMEMLHERFAGPGVATLLAKLYGALLVSFYGCCLLIPQAGRLDQEPLQTRES